MDQNLAEKITLSILATVAFAILAWDHCLLLPAEYQVYTYLKKSWRDPRPWLFIMLRYTGLAALLANMVMTSVRHHHCDMASEAHWVFYVLLMIAFCTLVTLRVSAIWKYHPDVVCALGILGLAVVGLWIAVATQIRPIVDSTATLVANCALRPFPSWFSSTYAAALAFNLTAFSLAAAEILVKSSDANRDMRKDVRLLALLIACTAASVAILIVSAMGPEQQSNKQAASGFFILIIVSMGSRICLTFRSGEQNRLLFTPTKTPSYTFRSWGQNTSTINQSGITSVPGELTVTKPTTASSHTDSISTNGSHFPPFGASLSPPPARHQPSNSSTSASTQQTHSPSPSGGASSAAGSTGGHQHRATNSSILMSPQPSTTTASNSPILFRVEQSLPNTSGARQGTRSGARREVDSSGKGSRSNSRSPGRRHKKLPDMQSGWIDS